MTNHEQELLDLQTYFKIATFPKLPIYINKYMKVSDPTLFIETQTNRIEQFKGCDDVSDILLTHLRKLKVAIEKMDAA